MKCIKKIIAIGATLATCCSSVFFTIAASAEISDENVAETFAVTSAEVTANAEKAYDYYNFYYVENYKTVGNYGGEWMDATFQMGALDLYEITLNGNYLNDVTSSAEARNGKLNGGEATGYLDSLAYAQVLCRLDYLGALSDLSGVKEALDYCVSFGIYNYSWVDEIYMLGFVNAYMSRSTGNPVYSSVDFISYCKWREQLLDFEEGLWYRDTRYVYGMQNPSGRTIDNKKVLWSRGNAWVYVSLARRLSEMETADPSYATYLYDFKMMSRALISCQRGDGFWNVNLSDSQVGSGKETTGTAGFLFGLSIGIKLGVLNGSEYSAAADKAYAGLAEYALKENGAVGYCQPVGWDPADYSEATYKDSTNSFGVGLFIMGLAAYSQII